MTDPESPWQGIADVPTVSAEVEAVLGQLTPLQHAWQEAAAGDPDTFQETRLRALRSHAIETGIIERLYDVDWGVTEALVAEGISQEVVERAGGTVGRDTLAVIHDQYEALEFVSEAAKGQRMLSVSFIRELHQLITRHQETYEATDTLGRTAYPPLLHGEWKRDPNHVTRPDGSLLEYCPPLRVQDQMDRLVAVLEGDRSHPVVRAAWLHHRFISIHPFQDGNGRVARALVLLELLSAHYAPLVVGRDVRARYIAQLDRANEGDLEPLILLMADLERQAMIRQFQAPFQSEPSGSVLDVARAAAAKLSDLQRASRQQKTARLTMLAAHLNVRIEAKLRMLDHELEQTFRPVDPVADVWVRRADVGTPEAGQYHGQLVKLARRHQFYANLSEGSWWSTLTLRLFEERLRLLVAVVRVGSGDTGVGAVIIQAERLFKDQEDQTPTYEWLFEPTELDQIAITGELEFEALWPEVDQLIDRCLSVAIAEFTRTLG
jgi:prophage maintenance system killer protein